MKKNNNGYDETEMEARIIKTLRETPMTIEEVSKSLGINRITASKYLAVLEVKSRVSCRIIGRAKLYSVKK